MPKYKIRLIIVMAVMMLLSAFSLFGADIQYSEKAQVSKSVSQKSQGNYLLTVEQIKELVDTGKCKEARKGFNQFKIDFPEIASPDSNDLSLFIEAEMLRCKGQLTKAARTYSRLMDEFPPGSRFYEAALERQFRIATAFLAGEKRPVLGVFKIKGYAEGVRIMDGISYRLALDDPDGIGIQAAVAVAKSYQERKKYDEAYYRWAEIHEQHNTNRLGKQALLEMAQCRQALYKGHQYDTSDLIGRPLNPQSYYDSAKSNYEKFKRQYPQDADEFNIEQRLNEIDEQLAFKQFEIGRYYQERGNMLSANLYYKMVFNRWPETDAAKMAGQMLIQNTAPEEKNE